MEAYRSVVDCDNPIQFEHRVQAFQVICSHHSPYLLIM